MKIAVSNLSFMGFNCMELKRLPPDAGIEIFYEFGNTHFWEEFLGDVYGREHYGRLSLHGPCMGINLANRKHTHYRAYYEQLFTDAARWRASFVVVHTNEAYDEPAAAVKNLIYDRLDTIMRIADKYNVRVVLENVGLLPKSNLIFDWAEYQQLLKDFPQAGALLDVGHAFINQWPLLEVLKTLGDRITACHLHDNDGHSDLHLPIGEGDIQWADFFAGVRQYSPHTLLVFEYANVSLETVARSMSQVRSTYFR